MAITYPRHKIILELLSEQGSVSAQELVERFHISIATAYRDLSQLVGSGLAIKASGGITLAPSGGAKPAYLHCHACGHLVANRTAFTVQLSDLEQLTACCPHCGLLLLGQHPDAQTGIATDFLYGKKINVSQATFLVNSRVTLCCSPAVLCFAHEEEAENFRKGFDGEVLGYEAARDWVTAMMSLSPHHSHLEA